MIDPISSILARGREQGVFRDGRDAVGVHMVISSFAVCSVADRHTFDTPVGRDPLESVRRAHYRRMLGDMVVSHLRAGS